MRFDRYGDRLVSCTKSKCEWAATVRTDRREGRLFADGNTLVLHAGRDYYDGLLPRLDVLGVNVEIPTEGLPIGKRLAWYNERL